MIASEEQPQRINGKLKSCIQPDVCGDIIKQKIYTELDERIADVTENKLTKVIEQKIDDKFKEFKEFVRSYVKIYVVTVGIIISTLLGACGYLLHQNFEQTDKMIEMLQSNGKMKRK